MNKNSVGTTWQLYTTNEGGWEAMLDACKRAKKSIDLEQFIFRTDEIGKKFLEVCLEKAAQGVQVRLIWDAAGSFSFFGSPMIDDLKKRGIELTFFQTLFPSIFKFHNFRSWYFRDHKRTLVVDNEIGFTGSICVSEEMRNWRDTVVKIEGPVVEEMSLEFERMRNRALGKKTSITPINTLGRKGDFHYVTNYPLPRQHHLYKEIIRKIRNAEKCIYITTPYFVPTRHLSRVLRAAARRGVDLKIIIPEYSDHPIVDLCSRSFFSKLLKAGIKIHLYQGAMIHSKTMVIDGDWSTVGTLNMDTASLIYNFEANIISTNTHFSQELEDHFLKDLKETRELTYKEWKGRYWVEKFLGFFARLLRDFM